MAFSTKADSRAYYRKLHSENRCVSCGKETGGLCRCPVCRDIAYSKRDPVKMREYQRRWQERNRIELNRRARVKAKLNHEHHRVRNLEYRHKNPKKIREYRRKYYAAHREKLSAQSLFYQNRDKATHLARRRELRRINNKRENLRTSLWKKNNRPKMRVYERKKRQQRIKNDPSFIIQERLRTRIRMAVSSQGGVKARRTIELLGCSLVDFTIYIESKFEVGMSWENWGHGADKWNLDHIIPCSLFDLTQAGHQKRCFHFSNYQPMWQVDNFKKGSRCSNPQFRLL